MSSFNLEGQNIASSSAIQASNKADQTSDNDHPITPIFLHDVLMVPDVLRLFLENECHVFTTTEHVMAPATLHGYSCVEYVFPPYIKEFPFLGYVRSLLKLTKSVMGIQYNDANYVIDQAFPIIRPGPVFESKVEGILYFPKSEEELDIMKKKMEARCTDNDGATIIGGHVLDVEVFYGDDGNTDAINRMRNHRCWDVLSTFAAKEEERVKSALGQAYDSSDPSPPISSLSSQTQTSTIPGSWVDGSLELPRTDYCDISAKLIEKGPGFRTGPYLDPNKRSRFDGPPSASSSLLSLAIRNIAWFGSSTSVGKQDITSKMIKAVVFVGGTAKASELERKRELESMARQVPSTQQSRPATAISNINYPSNSATDGHPINILRNSSPIISQEYHDSETWVRHGTGWRKGPLREGVKWNLADFKTTLILRLLTSIELSRWEDIRADDEVTAAEDGADHTYLVPEEKDSTAKEVDKKGHLSGAWAWIKRGWRFRGPVEDTKVKKIHKINKGEFKMGSTTWKGKGKEVVGFGEFSGVTVVGGNADRNLDGRALSSLW